MVSFLYLKISTLPLPRWEETTTVLGMGLHTDSMPFLSGWFQDFGFCWYMLLWCVLAGISLGLLYLGFSWLSESVFCLAQWYLAIMSLDILSAHSLFLSFWGSSHTTHKDKHLIINCSHPAGETNLPSPYSWDGTYSELCSCSGQRRVQHEAQLRPVCVWWACCGYDLFVHFTAQMSLSRTQH